MLYQSERNNIVIDVTKAPYFADNTGRVDCTDILCRVLDDILIREVEGVDAMRARLMADPREDCRIGFENRKVKGVPTVIFPEDPPTAKLIYFPRGTYLVSDTITYSLETLKNTINDKYSSELNRFIHIVGEDKEHTIIRLQDNCRPFRYGEKRPVLSLMRGAFSNVAMMNTVENITIDLGKGNPGAIGLYYVASNTGRVQNLNVVATDGFGYAGIHLDLGLNCVFKDLYISDCKTGILNTSHGHDQIYENLVMERVETGVDSTGGLIGLLNAHISCRGTACVSRNFNMLSVLNSHLIHEGEKGGTGIRNVNAYVLVRDTQIDNFGTAISEMYEAAIKENGYIDEYSNSLEYRMFTKWDGRFRLPIEPQPTYTWNGDRSIVAEGIHVVACFCCYSEFFLKISLSNKAMSCKAFSTWNIAIGLKKPSARYTPSSFFDSRLYFRKHIGIKLFNDLIIGSAGACVLEIGEFLHSVKRAPICSEYFGESFLPSP